MEDRDSEAKEIESGSEGEESNSGSSPARKSSHDSASDRAASPEPQLSPRVSSSSPSPSPELSSNSSGGEEEEEEPEDSAPADDKRITNLMKKGKRAKRSKTEETDERDENAADQLLKEMENAAKEDEKANRESRPAINKLKLLDKVLRFMKVGRLKELFIQMNGAAVLQLWLKWLPDHSFPHAKIVTGVLRAINEMDIPTEHLEQYGLQQCVSTLEQHHNDVEVRKLARNLLDKWVRERYGIDTKWSSLEKNEDVDTRDYEDRTAPETNLHKLIQQDQPTEFIRIPLRNQFDFKRRPQSKHLSNGAIDTKLTGGSLTKRLKNPSRQRQKKYGGKMSADGKGLIE